MSKSLIAQMGDFVTENKIFVTGSIYSVCYKKQFIVKKQFTLSCKVCLLTEN